MKHKFCFILHKMNGVKCFLAPLFHFVQNNYSLPRCETVPVFTKQRSFMKPDLVKAVCEDQGLENHGTT